MEDGIKLIWLFDIREPSNPISISTFPTPSEADYVAKGGHFGPHNVYENRPDGFVSSETIFATYQNAGVRVFDIRDQYRPTEIGAFVPPRPRASLITGRTGRWSSSPATSSSTSRGSSTPTTTTAGSTSSSTRADASRRLLSAATPSGQPTTTAVSVTRLEQAPGDARAVLDGYGLDEPVTSGAESADVRSSAALVTVVQDHGLVGIVAGEEAEVALGVPDELRLPIET